MTTLPPKSASPVVELAKKEARRQGYANDLAAWRMARRALRWLRSPLNNGVVAPSHIKLKIQLLRVVS